MSGTREEGNEETRDRHPLAIYTIDWLIQKGVSFLRPSSLIYKPAPIFIYIYGLATFNTSQYRVFQKRLNWRLRSALCRFLARLAFLEFLPTSSFLRLRRKRDADGDFLLIVHTFARHHRRHCYRPLLEQLYQLPLSLSEVIITKIRVVVISSLHRPLCDLKSKTHHAAPWLQELPSLPRRRNEGFRSLLHSTFLLLPHSKQKASPRRTSTTTPLHTRHTQACLPRYSRLSWLLACEFEKLCRKDTERNSQPRPAITNPRLHPGTSNIQTAQYPLHIPNSSPSAERSRLGIMEYSRFPSLQQL